MPSYSSHVTFMVATGCSPICLADSAACFAAPSVGYTRFPVIGRSSEKKSPAKIFIQPSFFTGWKNKSSGLLVLIASRPHRSQAIKTSLLLPQSTRATTSLKPFLSIQTIRAGFPLRVIIARLGFFLCSLKLNCFIYLIEHVPIQQGLRRLCELFISFFKIFLIMKSCSFIVASMQI